MLKCHLDYDKNIATVESKGSILDAFADLIYLLNSVYNAFQSRDKRVAHEFKDVFQKIVADDESPIWEYRGQEDGITSVTIQLPDNFRPDADG